MRVEHSIDLGEGHAIELGGATWNEDETSVRNRYPRNDGGFNINASSEVPIRDLVPMVGIVADHDVLSELECIQIIESLVLSLKRRT